VEKYTKERNWELMDGDEEAFNIAGDEAGAIWIRNSRNRIMKWDAVTNEWIDMGLEGAN